MRLVADRRPLFETRGVQLVLVLAAVVGVLIGIDTLVIHLRLDPLADVHAYYDAGARLNAGLPLYDQPAGTDSPRSTAIRPCWRSSSGRWRCSRSSPLR